MAYTREFSISLGSSKTGLTLNAQIVDTAGTNVGSAITTGITEIGGGTYLLHCMTIPDSHQGGIKIYSAGSPSTIWAFASINTDLYTETRVAAQVAATLSASALTFTRGDTFSVAITGLGNISTRTKLWFTLKLSDVQADTAATLLIEESAGLTVVNGAAYTITANGSIVVSDATLGNLTLTLKPAVTAVLTPSAGLVWDIQVLTSAPAVQTLTAGAASIIADVTRAIA